jgi:hypothetical protein
MATQKNSKCEIPGLETEAVFILTKIRDAGQKYPEWNSATLFT